MPRQDYLLLPRARVLSVPMAWGHNDDFVLVKRRMRLSGGETPASSLRREYSPLPADIVNIHLLAHGLIQGVHIDT